MKVHVAVSLEGLLLKILISPGNEHDSQRFEQVMAGIKIKIGIGRPRTKPDEVMADAAYDTEAIRMYLSEERH